jgi:hypothetical protein
MIRIPMCRPPLRSEPRLANRTLTVEVPGGTRVKREAGEGAIPSPALFPQL